MRARNLCRSLAVSLLFFSALNAAGADLRLIDAVRKGDVPVVRSLLQQRVNVNASEADGTTALHWAARLDDAEIAKVLIRAGANSKASNRYGVTPLSLACINGSSTMIELFLTAGADPNTTMGDGETALMTAARTGKVDAVNTLLMHGADVNATEGWRAQTALMWAAAEGYTPVIQTLIAHGANIHARSNGGFTALLFAAREGRIDSSRTLLDLGASLNDSLPVNSRRRADASRPAVPETGVNAFLIAAGNAHYELAAFFLDRGADPNAAPQGYTALHQVSWVRKAGIAGSNDPAPEGSGNMDSLEFVKRLVKAGANLNARATKRPPVGVSDLNMIGGTPFLLAARTADADLMRLLVELGADPLLTNDDNTTPLMAAAGVGTHAPGEDPGTETEMVEAVKVALDLGNDVNAVDKNGETAMHGAAYKFAPSVVQLLVASGARMDIWNRKNKKGWTPLNIAEGIQRGMNIVGNPATADAIRQAMSATAAIR
jgi:uncharacterized protein